jgi:DNA-binding transcriptional regulator YhcF (GntR family)
LEQVKFQISSGLLKPGDELPSHDDQQGLPIA